MISLPQFPGRLQSVWSDSVKFAESIRKFFAMFYKSAHLEVNLFGFVSNLLSLDKAIFLPKAMLRVWN